MSKRIGLRLLVSGLVLLGGAACGGSASETPPPLEPDPRGNNYLGNYGHASVAGDADAGALRPAVRSGSAGSEPPASRAAATWGSGRGSAPR
ncbi:MAG TPA: hypothetical protein VGI10_24000 [Polyangiaceae bacterium]